MRSEKYCVICNTSYMGTSVSKYCGAVCRRIVVNNNSKRFARKDPEKSKEIWKKARLKSKDKRGIYRQERRHSLEGYVDRALERIKIHTLDSDIDRQFLLDLLEINNYKCVITNKPFIYKNPYNSFHNPLAPSVDRIDSTKGYYRNNVQIVLACINRMKNDLPNEDFLSLWSALVNG